MNKELTKKYHWTFWGEVVWLKQPLLGYVPLLLFHLYQFLLMKALSVHIAPISNEYAMKTIGVHSAPAKWCC